MGKSTSCFKIISCGNDSLDKDDLEVSESKASSDKRGWSFRKRSARHRVLSNTVITESPTSGNKETQESVPHTFQPPAITTAPEKVSVIQCNDEKPQLLTPEIPENPKLPETENVVQDQVKVDEKVDESVVVVVQTAVRGLLAQKSLLELKKVVKLQAAVRGHLVRRHAVGTLRCVQAIVKMQALIRARRARLSSENEDHSSKISKKGNATYISIERLLSNSFARQLLASTPKNQPIHVKCDPSKPDSAWKWMEMWMAVSTKDTPHVKEAVSDAEQQEIEKEEILESPRESKIQYFEADESNFSTRESKIQYFEADESNFSTRESIGLSETEENLITYDADNLNIQASHSTSDIVRGGSEEPQLENTSTSDAKETSVDINCLSTQSKPSDADSYMEFKAVSEKPVIETEQPKRSMKRSASDELETDGKKSVFGSRKVTNPAFVAAQSKFEELASTTNSARSVSPSPQDVSGAESHRDMFSSEADTEVREKELNVEENPVPHGSQVSECGTEISISSTLDSPDRSDTVEHDHETKASGERVGSPNCTTNIHVEAKDLPELAVSDLCEAVTEEPEKVDVVNGGTINSEIGSPQNELKPERTISDTQREQDTAASMQAYDGSTPGGSPRSHLTVPEPQVTPSSTVSVKSKKSKGDKSASSKKHMSPSAGKKSPSNPNHDSGSSKDQKNGKRRNSFGSSKPDEVDQEPRDSSDSSSIPRFMQATESARAKLQASTSPRSSPDMQEREIYIKKRHSLSGANGRQGSPRIVRSMSQAQTQPGAKGTERKWQR